MSQGEQEQKSHEEEDARLKEEEMKTKQHEKQSIRQVRHSALCSIVCFGAHCRCTGLLRGNDCKEIYCMCSKHNYDFVVPRTLPWFTKQLHVA